MPDVALLGSLINLNWEKNIAGKEAVGIPVSWDSGMFSHFLCGHEQCSYFCLCLVVTEERSCNCPFPSWLSEGLSSQTGFYEIFMLTRRALGSAMSVRPACQYQSLLFSFSNGTFLHGLPKPLFLNCSLSLVSVSLCTLLIYFKARIKNCNHVFVGMSSASPRRESGSGNSICHIYCRHF